MTVVGRPDVLVKTRVSTSTHKVRREIATRSEVMYLELNRGRRGVPRLYGGWRDAREDRVYYVVQRAGSPMVVDEVSNNSSAAWLAFCRADPVVCRRRPFYVVSTPSTRLLDGVCSMRAGDAMSARWTSTPSTRRPLDSLVHTRRYCMEEAALMSRVNVENCIRDSANPEEECDVPPKYQELMDRIIQKKPKPKGPAPTVTVVDSEGSFEEYIGRPL